MIVSDRQQMAQVLNERMTRTYSSLSERQELELDTSLVKTYLLEAHLSEEDEPSVAASLARKSFSSQTFGKNITTGVHRADEASLLSVAVKAEEEEFVVYVDFTNTRFWVLHTMGSSTATDWIVDRLVRVVPDLDRAWLPADLLEQVSRLGAFRGLSLDYDRRVIPDVDFQSEEAPVEFLKMQLWGNKAGNILRVLRQENAFPHETTLSKVKVKFWLGEHSDGNFAIDDIKFDGKVTARGTSFQSHIGIVSKVYDAYAVQVRLLESRNALRSKLSGDRLLLEGEPVNFLLGRPISDLDVFCESVFSSGPPFRLWGVPVRLGRDSCRVRAVDLHSGAPLHVEVGRDYLRVYLPEGSCGNSILRLYTNLQHHYDSQIKMADGDGRSAFGL